MTKLIILYLVLSIIILRCEGGIEIELHQESNKWKIEIRVSKSILSDIIEAKMPYELSVQSISYPEEKPMVFNNFTGSVYIEQKNMIAGGKYLAEFKLNGQVVISKRFVTKPPMVVKTRIHPERKNSIWVDWSWPDKSEGLLDNCYVKFRPCPTRDGNCDSNFETGCYFGGVCFIEKYHGEELMWGALYQIEIYTQSRVDDHEIDSDPSIIWERTMSREPSSIEVDQDTLSSYYFDIELEPPIHQSEHNGYLVKYYSLVYIGDGSYLIYSEKLGEHCIKRNDDELPIKIRQRINDLIEPGKTFEVYGSTIYMSSFNEDKCNLSEIESYSDSVSRILTTRPLHVEIVNVEIINQAVLIEWETDEKSTQDSFVVQHYDLADNSETNRKVEKIMETTSISLSGLIPGHNYSISVLAVSNYIASRPIIITVENLDQNLISIVKIEESNETGNYYAIPVSFVSSRTFVNNTEILDENHVKALNVNELEREERIEVSSTISGNYYSIPVSTVSSRTFSDNAEILDQNLVTIMKDKKIKSPENSETSQLNLVLLVFLVLVVFVLLFVLGSIFLIYFIRQMIRKPNNTGQQTFDLITFSDPIISINESDQETPLIMVEQNLILRTDDLIFGNPHQIGSGQFGTVFEGSLLLRNGIGVRTGMDIKVVMKISNDINRIDELKAEAMIMKGFEHKNVLSLIGISFESNGTPLIVLPFMKNGDLLAYLRNDNNRPTVKQLLLFAIDVAKGMEYLSAQHFIHRDLAARNCMLDNDLSVKVADFGLSCFLENRDIYKSNSSGMLPLRWMAIESIEKREYSTKSDVWSYVVLVWEILTRGVTPYFKMDGQEVYQFLTSGQRLPQPVFCPDQIYDILVKCWSVIPEERPYFIEIETELVRIIMQLEMENRNNQVGIKESNAYYNFLRLY